MQERWHLLCLNDSLTSLPPPGAPGQLQQAQVLGSPSPFAVATHQGWGSLGMSCDGRESPPPEPWLSGVGSSRGAAGRQQLPCRSISAAQDRSLGSGPTVSEMSQWSVPCPTCWGGFVTCPHPRVALDRVCCVPWCSGGLCPALTALSFLLTSPGAEEAAGAGDYGPGGARPQPPRGGNAASPRAELRAPPCRGAGTPVLCSCARRWRQRPCSVPSPSPDRPTVPSTSPRS